MKQHRVELALRRLVWIVLRKFHDEFVDSALPRTAFLARNLALPLEQLLSFSVGRGHGLGSESEGVFLAPVLALLHESLSRDIHPV